MRFDITSDRCRWCDKPLNVGRVDSKTCSQPCRQAWNRFIDAVPRAPAPADGSFKTFGYADPPYPGFARRYYAHEEVDHAALVAQLELKTPDGWALSTNSASLRAVLALCPADVRVAAWVKGSRKVKARFARQSWEPVILRGGRDQLLVDEVLDDSLICATSARARSHPGALIGMKPAAFSAWVFRMLGARIGDALIDVFPGSGAVSRAWDLHTAKEAPQ